MIAGVGTDIVEIGRIRRMMAEPAWDRFVRRVLTDRELALAEERSGRLAEFVAGRFAAKEAVVKALGCGIGSRVGFRDIEILPGNAGEPQCELAAAALERLGFDPAKRDAPRLHISISHSGEHAVAFAVAEKPPL